MQGIVFQIQRFSLYDGPGIRTVVFLKGCPLRCIWCHNPEGICTEPQIMYNPAQCIGCGTCAGVCPQGCHLMRSGGHLFARDQCISCGKCAEACFSRALSVVGKRMSADEVMEEVLRDLPFYRESGGGLTLSGGEPFMQPGFALALLKSAKEHGIFTCVETSGETSEQVIREAYAYVDDFYYDYKATGEKRHRELCGVSQAYILSNLALLDELDAKVTLRCPLVKDQNLSKEHISGIAETAAVHRCIREVHLEPYHSFGIGKAHQLGQENVFRGRPPGKEELASYQDYISKNSGKKCSISW